MSSRHRGFSPKNSSRRLSNFREWVCAPFCKITLGGFFSPPCWTPPEPQSRCGRTARESELSLRRPAFENRRLWKSFLLVLLQLRCMVHVSDEGEDHEKRLVSNWLRAKVRRWLQMRGAEISSAGGTLYRPHMVSCQCPCPEFRVLLASDCQSIPQLSETTNGARL